MATDSPRSSHHKNDRRPVVDGSDEGTQSGKIPRISETPHAEKANADLNKRVLGRDVKYAEGDERDIG